MEFGAKTLKKVFGLVFGVNVKTDQGMLPLYRMTDLIGSYMSGKGGQRLL